MAGPFMYASPEQVMKDKADYARKGIARGKPIAAMEYADGIVFVAENPSATLHKISEIYDRIAFAGVGKHNEYENLRVLGIRQAEMKGYAYARDDVNARSLANLYSQVLGQVFTDQLKPFEVEILVAGVGATNGACDMYRVNYAGEMIDEHGFAALGGQEELTRQLHEHYREGASLADAVRAGSDSLQAVGSKEIPSGQLEIAVLDRTLSRRKFRRLPSDEVERLRSG